MNGKTNSDEIPNGGAQARSKKKPRWLRWTLRILLSVATLLVLASAGVYWFITTYLDNFISTRLANLVVAASDSLYTLKIQKFTFNADTIQASGLKLVPIFEPSSTDDKQRYDISIQSLQILKPRWNELFNERKFHIEFIELDEPYLMYRRDTLVAKSKSEQEKQLARNALPEPTLLDRLFNFISPRLQLDSFRVRNAALNYENVDEKEQRFDNLVVSVFAEGIELNLKASKNQETFSAKDIRIHITPYRWKIPNTLYGVKCGDIRISTKDSLLTIDSLSLAPIVTDTELFREQKYRTDRFKLRLDRLRGTAIDYKGWVFGKGIIAKTLEMSGLVIDVLTDKRYPISRQKFIPTMPHEAFRALPIRVAVDSIIVHNGNIRYSVQNPHEKSPRSLFFSKVDAAITNLNNDSLKMTDETPAVLKASAYLMGTGKVSLVLDLPLLSETFSMRYHGELGRFDVKQLNSFAASEARVMFPSGKVERVSFSVEVEDGFATGSVQAIYKDLSLKVLPQNRKYQAGLLEGVISFVANTFVVHRECKIEKGKPLRSGKIAVRKKKEKAFFEFFWETLWQGIQGVIKR
ncbi:MAG: hypothetical protein HY22_11200 [[Candidatus Thermochlorobacteriaceae] bacterium GBChlB]|nr:MAG: hypothetical protein HY22_11200 [[Candidatus Thermochlorobacteriaceae] bacterium GBChlB]